MTFQEVYKFPLVLKHSKVFTHNYIMAFDFVFMKSMFDRDSIVLNPTQQEELVAIINGYKKAELKGKLEYNKKEAVITLDDKILMVIRGWGHLTGVGGLNLKPEKAALIQDEFAEYIIKKLNG